MDIIYIVTGLVGILLGFTTDRFLLRRSLHKKLKEAEEEKKLIIKEAEVTAESIKKDKILEAKEKFLKLKSEFEEESNRKKNLIISNENKERVISQTKQANGSRVGVCQRKLTSPTGDR